MISRLLLFLTFFFSTLHSFTAVITVQNTNDSGVGSLRMAVSIASNGDEIRFNPSLISGGSDTIKLTSEISINKGVTIKGLYNSTDTIFISGEDSVRAFNIDLSSASNKNMVFDSIVVINGFDDIYGGGINFTAGNSLTIKNAVIKNNQANTGGGVSCRTSYSTSSSANYSVSVYNTIIKNNTSAFDGGGIFVSSFYSTNNTSISLTIDNSIITGNSGKSAINLYPISYSANATGSLNLNKSHIYNNNSSQYTIKVSPQSYSSTPTFANVTVDSSVVSNNIGGGIYGTSNKSSLTLTNTHIINNTLQGGVHLNSGDRNSTLNITSCIIKENTSNSPFGGGVTSRSRKSSLVTINKSTIINNTSNSYGGGIYSRTTSDFATDSSAVTIINSTIANNSANSGGGIYSSGNTFDFSKSNVQVINSTVANNTGSTRGDNIFSDASSPSSSRITIASSIIFKSNASSSIDSPGNNIISNGYNIFNDSINGVVSSDQVNIDSAALNLLPLADNGNNIPTMLPGPFSIAINQGNPSDLIDAQNGVIIGVRDVGAAENGNVYAFDTITTCDSLIWVDGKTYYNDTLTTYSYDNIVNGNYDSIVSLNLSVNYSSRDTINQIVCDSLISPSGNYSWSTSGTYMDTVPNMFGCDSILTFNLIFNYSVRDTITQNVCDSLVSPSGNYTWTTSGTYIDTVLTSKGCDSIITFNLTVNYTSLGSDNLNICLGDSVLINGYWFYNDTVVNDTVTSSTGCDSIVAYTITTNSVSLALDLGSDRSICHNDSTTLTTGIYDSYLWSNGDTTMSITIDANMTGVGNFIYWAEVTETITGCKNRDSVLVEVVQCVGLEEAINNRLISIYPNPVTQRVITVNFKEYDNSCSIELRDVNGKLISKSQRNRENKIKLNIDEEKGLYFITIKTNHEQFTTKIIKY